jgi:hypothetical protein
VGTPCLPPSGSRAQIMRSRHNVVQSTTEPTPMTWALLYLHATLGVRCSMSHTRCCGTNNLRGLGERSGHNSHE